jgi:hypothetical protein
MRYREIDESASIMSDGGELLIIETELSEDESKIEESLKFKRKSIICQGDVYNERITKRQALQTAGLDNRRMVPLQCWYDSLRESDDGRFSSVVKNEAMENYAKIKSVNRK